MREVHEYIRTMRTGFTVQSNDGSSEPDKLFFKLQEAFVDITIDHGLASTDTADKTYRKALGKMKKIGIDKI